MRQIGTIPEQTLADRLAAFLITQGIAAHAEQDGLAWAIWVRDEDRLEEARRALAEFLLAPDAPRYRGVEREAGSLIEEAARRNEQARKNVITMRGQWNRSAAQSCPLVMAIIATCVVVALLSNFGNRPSSAAMRSLQFCDTRQSLDWDSAPLANRLIDIRGGQLWRVITPAFVHFGLLHLGFNMIMLFSFGRQIEGRLGTARLGLLMLVIAVVSNLAQALAPEELGGGPFFGGMSGVVYGLLGYLWIKTLYQPESGLFVAQSTFVLLMIWMFLGFVGVLNMGGMSIANWAHGAGLVMGLVIAYLPLFRRR